MPKLILDFTQSGPLASDVQANVLSDYDLPANGEIALLLLSGPNNECTGHGATFSLNDEHSDDENLALLLAHVRDEPIPASAAYADLTLIRNGAGFFLRFKIVR